MSCLLSGIKQLFKKKKINFEELSGPEKDNGEIIKIINCKIGRAHV